MSDLSTSAAKFRGNPARGLFDAIWPAIAAIAFALFMHLLVRPSIDAYWAILLLNIGINVTLGVSLTMVNGFTGQFSMGHAGFLAVGGYTAGAITYYGSHLIFGSPNARPGLLCGMPIDTAGLPFLGGGEWLFVLAIIVGGVVAAGLGYIVGLPSLRLRGDYLAIVTLGFGEIVRVMIQQSSDVVRSTDAVRAMPIGQTAISLGGSLGFGDLPKYTSTFWVFLVAALTLLVAYRIKSSSYGRAFLSIREDEVASGSMGVNTTKFKVRAFVLAAFFAGIAGGLYGHTLGVALSPADAGFQKSFDIIIIVVLGGLGSISGAALAAIIVTILPEQLRAFAEYRMIIYALALILLMLFRPQGLLGVREIWDASVWSWTRRLFGKKKTGNTGGPA